MTCVHCGKEFTLSPNKPGKINECEDCAQDVPRIRGVMAWDDKNTPTLRLVNQRQLEQLNSQEMRRGIGTIGSGVVSEELEE